MSPRKTTGAPFPGAVIATIHSPASLKAARALPPGAVDFLELRVDAFAGSATELRRLREAAAELRAPLVVTVRDPREGGAHSLSAPRRAALMREFLDVATLLDLELRSATRLRLSCLLDEARERGIGVILSHHNFCATPPVNRLRELALRAEAAGACVFKLATSANTGHDLATLLDFLTRPLAGSSRAQSGLKLAVMGMGKFGKISRLALGAAGSVLNYGYLHRPQVPGQWPAQMLRERLRELASE